MDVLALVGRILLSLIFIASGVTAHFVNREQTVPFAASHGVPAPGVLVPVSGVVAVAGGLMVALGIWGDLGAVLLLAFSLATAFYMHAFWKESDAQMKMNQQAHFMKNVAMPEERCWLCSCSLSQATISA